VADPFSLYRKGKKAAADLIAAEHTRDTLLAYAKETEESLREWRKERESATKTLHETKQQQQQQKERKEQQTEAGKTKPTAFVAEKTKADKVNAVNNFVFSLQTERQLFSLIEPPLNAVFSLSPHCGTLFAIIRSLRSAHAELHGTAMGESLSTLTATAPGADEVLRVVRHTEQLIDRCCCLLSALTKAVWNIGRQSFLAKEMREGKGIVQVKGSQNDVNHLEEQEQEEEFDENEGDGDGLNAEEEKGEKLYQQGPVKMSQGITDLLWFEFLTDRIDETAERHLLFANENVATLKLDRDQELELHARTALSQPLEKLSYTQSTTDEVDRLLAIATDPKNLARMFEGWAPWI
jgi:hypothetical protein